MSANPLIDVVITCHNQDRFIGEAIDSVLSQTRLDAISKVVVVDDGSTDDSARVIAERAALNDRIDPLFQRPSGSPSGARNAGLERASAHFVAFLDGDDTWLPGKVEAELETIRKCPGAAIYYSGFIEAPTNGLPRSVSPKEYRAGDVDALERFFVDGAPIIPSAATVLRDVFATCGSFDESLRLAEDQDMWLRVLRRFSIQRVPAVTVHKRLHAGSLSASATSRLAYLENCEAISERMYAAEPGLRRVAPLRAARIARGRLRAFLQLGEVAAARQQAWRVIRLAPFNWRSWAVAGLGFLGWRVGP